MLNIIWNNKKQMEKTSTIYLSSLKDTNKLAKRLSYEAKKGLFISLIGDLGSGKTTFARFFINHLSKKKINVLSPSFPLVQVYEFPLFKVWHYDLFRLEMDKEIFMLDYEIAIKDIILMEWPERISKYLPKDRIDCFFKEDKNFKRRVELQICGDLKIKTNFND